MLPGSEPSPEPNYIASISDALGSIVEASAKASGVPVCLLSDSGSVVSASGGAPVPAGTYTPTREDVAVDVRHDDRVVGRLVVKAPPKDFRRELLDGFAIAAGVLMNVTRIIGEANSTLEHRKNLIDWALDPQNSLDNDEPYTEADHLRVFVKMLRQLLRADYVVATSAGPNNSKKWYASDGLLGDVPKSGLIGESVWPSGSAGVVVHEGIGTSHDLPATDYPLHAAEGGVSVLEVPLLRGGKALGAFVIGSRSSRHWTSADIGIARLIASRASLAVEQTRNSVQEHENRVFLEKLIEHVPGILLVLEPPDFRIWRTNNRALTGMRGVLPLTPLVGRTIREIIGESLPAEEMDHVISLLDRVVSTHEPLSIEEFAAKTPDGEATYWNWVAVPMSGIEGHDRPLVLLMAHEITDVVVARLREAGALVEASRQASELASHKVFLEKIIENFPGLLCVFGPPPDLRVVLANSQFTTRLPEPYAGGAPVSGLTLREVTDEWTEEAQRLVDLMASVYESKQPVSYEQYASSTPGQNITYWNWSVVPVGDDEGERYVMLLSHDVTDMVSARQQSEIAAELARARAEQLDAVINRMAEGVVLFGPEGNVVRMNPTGELLLGRGAIQDFHAGSQRANYGLFTGTGEPYTDETQPIVRALNGETVVGEQMILRRPHDEDVFIRLSIAPLKSGKGEVTGAVGVFHDVTQETLIDRLKNEFLSIVSHELRTPLTAIMGYSDLMLRGVHGSLSDRQAKALNSVRANANRLLHLINDLLDVSKLESGTVQLDIEPVDLGDTISRTVAHTRVLATEAGIAIHNFVPQRALPKVMADEAKVQQVIENLLTNAVKFTPEGGSINFEARPSMLAPDDPAIQSEPVDTVWTAKSLSDARSVVVTVRDTGTGLEGEQLTRIWDRFYQVDATARRKIGGAGLGLAIVRTIVEMHGGKVWANSDGTGMGSSFIFTLPASEEVVQPAILRPGAKSFTRMRPAIKETSTVLVAEDDEDQREIICEMLEMEGYTVVMANDGEEALEMAQAIQPSAIILDVILPLADGWEVLTLLKKNPLTKNIPVLIISVVDQPGFGKKLGATEYLLKPLEPQSLRTTVQKLVGGSASANAGLSMGGSSPD